jgi:hypothetical protein
MLFVEAGQWKAWLHDRDRSEGCFLTAVTPEQLLERMNEGLETGAMDWRPDRKGKR